MFIDYYKILGVDFDAERAAIKEAYRDLALKYHPDSNPGDKNAHQRFLELGEAYQTLSDIAERRKYNHKYLRHYKITTPKSSSASTITITRQKRASRYNRSRYNQRVRYRGNAGVGGTRRHTESEDIGYKNAPRSEAYHEYIANQAAMDEVGYTYFAKVLRFIALGILIFCLGMMGDYYSAIKTAPEPILFQTIKNREIGEPKLITIQTQNSRFYIREMYKNYMPIGEMIQIEKTPIGRVPIRVFIRDIYKVRKFPTSNGLYDNSIPILIVIVLLAMATLWFRTNPETNTYLGAFTVVVTIVLLTFLFNT